MWISLMKCFNIGIVKGNSYILTNAYLTNLHYYTMELPQDRTVPCGY